MFIPRKPYPHGLKLETVADADKYLFQIHLHRRTEQENPKPILLSQRQEKFSGQQFGVAPKKVSCGCSTNIVETIGEQRKFRCWIQMVWWTP